nr:MAG: hypothetical protein 3 [Tombusviridae sp.]
MRRRQAAPIALNPRLPRTTPGMPRVARGKDIIVNTVVTKSGSAGWQVDGYDINPRLSSSFPSANLTAQRYDMYEFTELRFKFHPTFANTTTSGVVFLAWEPNANRGEPAAVEYLNAFEYHEEGPVWSDAIELRVDQRHLPPPRYCRHLPTSSDLNLYDTGKLIVATDACSIVGSSVGYVEVFYSIRFFNYHLEDTLPVQSRAAYASLANLSSAASGAELVPTFTESFGSSTVTIPAGGGFILPAGKFSLDFMITLLTGGTSDNVRLQKDGVDVMYSAIDTGVNANMQHVLQGLITSTGTEVFKLIAQTNSGTMNSDQGKLRIEALS